MKSNFKDLTDLCEEITRQEESGKLDLVVSPENMLMLADGDTFSISGEHGGEFKINSHCHSQIASKTGIPKRYYDSMSELPDLRATNVNEWLRYREKNHLVRALDGKARAFLSDKFMPIDNYDIMKESLLPVIVDYKKQSSGDIKVISNCLSDKRMYLQIIFPSITAEVKKGDIVQAGINIRNSEVGAGALDVESLIWRLSCENGLVSKSLIKKYHVGKQINIQEEEQLAIFSRESIIADLKAWKLRIRDIIKHAIKGDVFNALVNKMIDATEDRIEKPQSVVKNVTKRYGLSESEGEKILENMIDEGENSRYGLTNGITHLAHIIDDIDRQYEVEKIGGQIIDITKNEWESLNVA